MRREGKCYRKVKDDKYEAYASDHSRFISLGTYNNEKEAINAVKQYKDNRLSSAVQQFGHKLEEGVVYEDKYVVFSNGDIFNINGIKMSPTTDQCGYLHGLINRRNCSYHRIVAECFVPNPYRKPDVNHINGIKTDNRADNLEWCNRSENVIHAYKIGLECRSFGVQNHNSKLNDDAVRYIRKSNKRNSDLAKEFKVDPSTIRAIRNKETWRHVV